MEIREQNMLQRKYMNNGKGKEQTVKKLRYAGKLK